MDKTDTKKKALLELLEKNLGIVTSSCRQAGVARSTYYQWLKDADFANKVDEIQNVALDFAESQLYTQIKKGNVAAIIFYMKTKGRPRGYNERYEITGADGYPTQIELNIVESKS